MSTCAVPGASGARGSGASGAAVAGASGARGCGSFRRAVAGAVNARGSGGRVNEAGRVPPRGGSTRPASAGGGWLQVAVAVVAVALIVTVVVPVAAVVPVTTLVAVVTVLPVAEFVPGAVVVAHITAGPASGPVGGPTSGGSAAAGPLAAALPRALRLALRLVARAASPCPPPSRRTIVAFPVRLSTSTMTRPCGVCSVTFHTARSCRSSDSTSMARLCGTLASAIRTAWALVMCLFTSATAAAGLAAWCGAPDVADATPATMVTAAATAPAPIPSLSVFRMFRSPLLGMSIAEIMRPALLAGRCADANGVLTPAAAGRVRPRRGHRARA